MARTPAGEQRKLVFAAARADFSAKGSPPEHTLDGDNTTGWSVTGQGDRGHVIVFELKEPQDFPAGTTLFLELEHRLTGVMTRFRLAATSRAAPLEHTARRDPRHRRHPGGEAFRRRHRGARPARGAL